MKVAIVQGTRPEIIKNYSIAKALAEAGAPFEVLHTNQHSDRRMCRDIYRDMGYEPTHSLGGEYSIGRAIEWLQRRLTRDQITHVLVNGDTAAALAGAVAAMYLDIPVAHVEAGLRSGDIFMREERNRIVVDSIAAYLFAYTRFEQRLLQRSPEVRGRVFLEGNTTVDVLDDFAQRIAPRPRADAYVFATLHRKELTEHPLRLRVLLEALGELAERHPVVFPVHPRTADAISRYGLQDALGRVEAIDPIGPFEALALQKHALAVHRQRLHPRGSVSAASALRDAAREHGTASHRAERRERGHRVLPKRDPRRHRGRLHASTTLVAGRLRPAGRRPPDRRPARERAGIRSARATTRSARAIADAARARGATAVSAPVPTLLSVNNYFYLRDGSEAVYLGHNAAFEAAGWEVIPFSMTHSENLPSPWSRYFVTDIELGERYTLAQKLRRVPKVIYSFEARRKLALLLEHVRPDIAHCHSVYHHISPSILGVLKARGIPVVMTLHDLKLACPAYHMFNERGLCEECKSGGLHRVLFNRCVKGSSTLSAVVLAEALLHRALDTYAANVDRFVVPSAFYAEKLAEWGWDRGRFVHVPNFVDCAAIRPDYTPGKAFLYFGRLSPEKGLLTLVRAAARAAVPLRLAGNGPQRETLEREAVRIGADVTFLGRLSGERLYSEVRAARATVLPSEWYENGPISVLESFAAGTPVIGAAIGGIPEHVTDSADGWLFESGSVEALAACLRRVAALPDSVVEAAGRAARATAERRFGIELYRERIADLYAGLLGAHGASRARS